MVLNANGHSLASSALILVANKSHKISTLSLSNAANWTQIGLEMAKIEQFFNISLLLGHPVYIFIYISHRRSIARKSYGLLTLTYLRSMTRSPDHPVYLVWDGTSVHTIVSNCGPRCGKIVLWTVVLPG